jgi:hypothetical protein
MRMEETEGDDLFFRAISPSLRMLLSIRPSAQEQRLAFGSLRLSAKFNVLCLSLFRILRMLPEEPRAT